MNSNRQKVLEILSNNNLTAPEIAEKLDMDLKTVQTYLYQFHDQGEIIKSGTKDRFKIYSIKPIKRLEKQPKKTKPNRNTKNIRMEKNDKNNNITSDRIRIAFFLISNKLTRKSNKEIAKSIIKSLRAQFQL